MGGILTVSSEPGRGSAFTFTVSLPVAETVLNRHLAPIPDLAGRRILLVEDNVLNQELVLALLAETGAGTDVAKDGDEALRCLERNPYDAVLMDLQMPGMDGFDTARAIRDRGAQLPILALTAREGALERCLEAGMAGLVAKPIEPRQLLEALAQAVRPAEILDRLAGHMDVAGALDRLGGRMDLLLHFLQRYLEEPIPLETIPAAMALGDRARAGQVAHDLKGFGASLGRVRAARLAGDLEARLLEEGPARWEPLYGELSQVEAEFLAAARVAMGTGAAAPPGG
jgi:CheY-like chemotaxis protein